MKQFTLKSGLAVAAAACLLAIGPLAARAQGGPGGGGFTPSPEMMAKFKEWGKWREEHKNVSTLQKMLMQIREINKNPDTKLNKTQSAKMLTILHAWRNKPTMSEDQAHAVQTQIGNILDLKQIKKMSTMQNPFGGGRPGGGGGFGGGGPRPGGPGGPGGRPGGFRMPDPPKGSYNPLNPDTSPFVQFRPQAKKGYDDFLAELQQQSK